MLEATVRQWTGRLSTSVPLSRSDRRPLVRQSQAFVSLAVHGTDTAETKLRTPQYRPVWKSAHARPRPGHTFPGHILANYCDPRTTILPCCSRAKRLAIRPASRCISSSSMNHSTSYVLPATNTVPETLRRSLCEASPGDFVFAHNTCLSPPNLGRTIPLGTSKRQLAIHQLYISYTNLCAPTTPAHTANGPLLTVSPSSSISWSSNYDALFPVDQPLRRHDALVTSKFVGGRPSKRTVLFGQRVMLQNKWIAARQV